MTARQHQRMNERELVIYRNNDVREGQQSTSRLRQLGFALATVSLTVVLCLGSAELLLRFLPVQSGLRTMPVNAQNPVFHFTPERDVTFSRDWNFDLVNHRRVNNAGWVNDQDYQHQTATPLLRGSRWTDRTLPWLERTWHRQVRSRWIGRRHR